MNLIFFLQIIDQSNARCKETLSSDTKICRGQGIVQDMDQVRGQ